MKTVLITGISSGIGFGMAKKFIGAGFKVIGSIRSSTKASELQALLGKNFFPVVFDVTNYWEIDGVVEQIKIELGDCRLDGLINNAGMTEIGPLLHISISDIRKQFETLVFGQLYVIQKFFPLLLPKTSDSPAGRIINISSVSGQSSNYFFGCYSAAKHALEGLSKTLREELKMYEIRVIVVAPGNIGTPLWGKQTSVLIDKYKDTVYYASLKKRVEYLNNEGIKNAMSIDEFSERLFTIFSEKDPANRYTVFKQKLPLLKEKIIVKRS